MASSTATVSAMPSAVMIVVVFRTIRFRRLYARGMAIVQLIRGAQRLHDGGARGAQRRHEGADQTDGSRGKDARQSHRRVDELQRRQKPSERTLGDALHQER